MLKSKVCGSVQEIILPDFPDDDNTVTTTVTKSRRVSFGPNFVKEFIVDSAVSAQCMSEYEQVFPPSDSSNTDSSHSGNEHSTFVVHENVKIHKTTVESESMESRTKPGKFASTICFSADSPTADMEFTEGCLTLAKSILDKKNKEMTVFIQAKPKEDEKLREEETNYFDGSQFEMSMTRCLKPKENRKFAGEKTKIFSKFDDEMSITKCDKVFMENDSWEDCKENRMPLDMIMHHLDKDDSDFENVLFNPEKSLCNILNGSKFDISDDSEQLNLNESMEISTDFQVRKNSSVSEDKVNDSKLTSPENAEVELSSNKLSKNEISSEKLTEDSEKVRTPTENPPDKINSFVNDCSFEKKESTQEMEVSEDIQQKLDENSSEKKMSFNLSVLKGSDDLNSNDMDVCTEFNQNFSKGSDNLPSFDDPVIQEELKDQEISANLTSFEEKEQEPVEVVQQNSIENLVVVDEKCEVSLEKHNTDEFMEINAPVIQNLLEDAEDAEMEVDGCEKSEVEPNFPEEIVNESKADPMEISAEFPPPVEEVAKDTTGVEVGEQTNEELIVQTEKSNESIPTEMEQSEVTEDCSEGDVEPSLGDLKVVESLKEQSKETGCVWSLQDLRHPQKRHPGLLSFECELLESSMKIEFVLLVSNEDSLDRCSVVKTSEITLNEEKQWRLREYQLAIDFGFRETKKYFEEGRQKVKTLRHVPYFLDQINSFVFRLNANLRQIHSILTSYPGSRLKDSVLSFRLFSFPIFFSSIVSIDLNNLFRLSDTSLSFEHDFGCLDEDKIRQIFRDCLKRENSLSEFIIQSTKYLFDMEKKSGCVSKRSHIRLLPPEIKQ